MKKGATKSSELLVVDQEPIQKEALKRLRAACAEQDRLQWQWKRFQERYLPDYEKWHALKFGPLLEEVRARSAELESLQRFVAEIHAETDMSGCSFEAAYREVMRYWHDPVLRERMYQKRAEFYLNKERKAREARERRHEKAVFDKAFNELATGLRGREREEFRSCLREQWEELREERAQEPPEEFTPPPEPAPEESQPPSAAREQEIKKTYRVLARSLHPDQNPNLSDSMRQLWHEVQDAYRGKDLERLQVCRSIVEVSALARFRGKDALEQLLKSRQSVSDLHETADYLRESLGSLRSALRKARKSLAWKLFDSSDPTSATLIAHHERERLEAEIRELRDEHASLSDWLAILERSARRGDRDGNERSRGRGRRRGKAF